MRPCFRSPPPPRQVGLSSQPASQPASQPRPQRISVAINPSEVLHQSGVAMVDGMLGPLTATEARAFNDVVGNLVPRMVVFRLLVLHRLRGIMIQCCLGVSLATLAFSFYMNDD